MKPTGERFQRSRIQAVGKHLGAGDMAPFHIEVQLHAAPAETLVDHMGKCRCLAEVPFPTALAGKGLNKAGQIGRGVRRNDFRGDPFAIMGKEGFADGIAYLLMGNAWQ